MKTFPIVLTVLSLAIAGCNRGHDGDPTGMTIRYRSRHPGYSRHGWRFGAAVATDANADASTAAMSTDGSAVTARADTTSGMAGDAAQTGDPLALGLLGAVDEHEIAAAKQAQARA